MCLSRRRDRRCARRGSRLVHERRRQKKLAPVVGPTGSLPSSQLHSRSMRYYLLRHDPDPSNGAAAGRARAERFAENGLASITHDLPETVKTSARPRPAAVDLLSGPDHAACRDRTAGQPERIARGPATRQPGRCSTRRSSGKTRISRWSWTDRRPIGSWCVRFPRRLSLPVLLDIDPAVASSENAGVQVELRLLRPKRAGDRQ